jgi:hypothetical protein
VRTVDITEFDGGTAVVEATTGIPAVDESNHGLSGYWIHENGAWRYDGCLASG